MILRNVTDSYRWFESWTYDRAIAPAVIDFFGLFIQKDLEILEGIPEDASILDIGCGGGQIAISLALKNPGWDVTGIDIAKEQIERASERGKFLGHRFAALKGSALDIPFSDSNFDFVLSIASIKHWTDKLLGIKEAIRVLKPGGSLVIIEADRACLLEDARSFVSLMRLPKFYHPIALAIFRTWVAGQSITIPEIESYVKLIGDLKYRLKKIEGFPGFLLQIYK